MTGPEFRAHRDILRWTQRETAEALGVTVTQISAIENGRSTVTPTIAILFGLYRRLDYPGHPTGHLQPGYLHR